ncbi:hypothetical protein RHDC3_00421 [Rhodocyclaceae bacterium]|nr:hypothetical protein RHDC3_00421 [Rhodocyclaceae bacterium]
MFNLVIPDFRETRYRTILVDVPNYFIEIEIVNEIRHLLNEFGNILCFIMLINSLERGCHEIAMSESRQSGLLADCHRIT